LGEPPGSEPIATEPVLAEPTQDKMVKPPLENLVADPSAKPAGIVTPEASAEKTVSNVPAQTDMPAETDGANPTVTKDESAAKLKGSSIKSELWDSIEQSNPAESIATLKSYLASDPKVEGHDLKVKQALTAVARDLATLHFDNSPAFKTWQQAVVKAVAPMVKDRALLTSLIAANAPSASGGRPNEGVESSGNGSGFNFILLDTMAEVDGAIEWLPHPKSKKFWTGTRVLVPKSISVPGQSGGQYLLMGTSGPSQQGGEGYKSDFTVLLALPL
jgi:hypothetical protein